MEKKKAENIAKTITKLMIAQADLLEQLQAENKRLREFAELWSGHDSGCDILDEGSPRTDCTCGYEKAREQALQEERNV